MLMAAALVAGCGRSDAASARKLRKMWVVDMVHQYPVDEGYWIRRLPSAHGGGLDVVKGDETVAMFTGEPHEAVIEER